MRIRWVKGDSTFIDCNHIDYGMQGDGTFLSVFTFPDGVAVMSVCDDGDPKHRFAKSDEDIMQKTGLRLSDAEIFDLDSWVK